jgi:hypothetical protein
MKEKASIVMGRMKFIIIVLSLIGIALFFDLYVWKSWTFLPESIFAFNNPALFFEIIAGGIVFYHLVKIPQLRKLIVPAMVFLLFMVIFDVKVVNAYLNITDDFSLSYINTTTWIYDSPTPNNLNVTILNNRLIQNGTNSGGAFNTFLRVNETTYSNMTNFFLTVIYNQTDGGGVYWNDYTSGIQFRVRNYSRETSGQYNFNGDGYQLGISITQGLTLIRYENNGSYTAIATNTTAFSRNTNYNISFYAIGNTFSIYRDGQLSMTYTDTKYNNSGMVIIRSVFGNGGGNTQTTNNTWDNFRLNELDTGINITNVYDENTLSPICYSVTMFNISYTYSTGGCGNIYVPHLLIPLGDVQLIFSNTSYTSRNYYLTGVTSQSVIQMTGYLLQTSESSYITGFVYSPDNMAGEPGVILNAQRFINSIWTTVDEKMSDYQGKFYFYLYPYTTYKIIATKGILNVTLDNYYPNPAIILSIYLNGTTIVENNLWTGINYTMVPTEVYLESPPLPPMGGVTRFNFTISASHYDLEYYFMELYRNQYGSSTLVYSQIYYNVSGGSIPVDVNITSQFYLGMDNFQAIYGFKKTGFGEWNATNIYHYDPPATYYNYNYSIEQALTDFKNGNIIQSQGVKYAFVLIIAITGAIAVSQMSGNTMGAMIVFISIIALFAYIGFFGTGLLDRWGFVAALAIIGTGIGFWRGW